MRKANDRLRQLEKSGETRSTAYREALRQMRIAEGDPKAASPRFSPSHFGSEKEMKKALEKFMGSETSTVHGVKRADVKTAQKISKNTGTAVSPGDVKKISDIWQAIRKGSSRYEAATDKARQKIIVKHKDKNPDDVASVLDRLQRDNVSIDQWEKQFDRYSKLEEANPTPPVDNEPLY